MPAHILAEYIFLFDIHDLRTYRPLNAYPELLKALQ